MTLDPRTIAELERLLAEATEEHKKDPTGLKLTGAELMLGHYARQVLPDLLRERRELRARVLDGHARRLRDQAIVDRWSCTQRHVNRLIRRVALLHHYADAIRAGRIK